MENGRRHSKSTCTFSQQSQSEPDCHNCNEDRCKAWYCDLKNWFRRIEERGQQEGKARDRVGRALLMKGGAGGPDGVGKGAREREKGKEYMIGGKA